MILQSLKEKPLITLLVETSLPIKIYSGFSFQGNKKEEQDVTMLIPVKAIKVEHPVIAQREKERKKQETCSLLMYQRSDNP